MLKKSPSQGFIYESVTPSRWSLNLIKKDRSTASNRITALHAHISEGSVRRKDFRAAWCDLLRTNVILPHKILRSEILHIIPNRNNLSTATLQQEVTSRCGVESSALAAAQHPLSLIMSRQSCLPQSLLLFKYRREPRGNTGECPLRGKWSLRDVFLETQSIRRTAWIVKALGWICWLLPSFPPRLIADVALNNTKPDAQGSLTSGPREESKSIHRKTWLVASSSYSLPRVNIKWRYSKYLKHEDKKEHLECWFLLGMGKLFPVP